MSISPPGPDAFLAGEPCDPHAVLGMHPLPGKKAVTVRAWLPGAERAEVFDPADARSHPLARVDGRGFFQGTISGKPHPFPYLLRSFGLDGERETRDPYAFLPTTSNEALAAFNKGEELRPHRILGANLRKVDDVKGVAFVVWAPNARKVNLVGEFNDWSDSLPMRPLGPSGCWELFVPAALPGHKYKYRICSPDGSLTDKADPFAAHCEAPPGNASIVADLSRLPFGDHSHLAAARNPWRTPFSAYEVHLPSWKRAPGEERPLSYLELAEVLPNYIRGLGFTHVEFLPVAEHPYGGSWGYQVTGFYAPTQRLGTPEEFARLVVACREAGLGVLLDWVPGHFPDDAFALARFDGSHLFEHQDPRQGRHADWGTLIFNYGRPEVRSFLYGSAFSWLDRFGVDGFRVDAVASMLYLDYSRAEGEWLPNEQGGNENLDAIEFLRTFHQALGEEYPGAVSIAEESTAYPKVTRSPSEGGLGFHFKWNMGWMHDVLAYLRTPQKERYEVHNALTFGATYQFSENFVQVFSHDEVVHGKGSMPNKMLADTEADRLAQLRTLYLLQWTWPGKKTLFMGAEFAHWKEWNCDDELDWPLANLPPHEGVRALIRDLNLLYRNRPAWAAGDHVPESFSWNLCDEKDRLLAFHRHGEKNEDTLLAIFNFADFTQEQYLRFPNAQKRLYLIDTASEAYGGPLPTAPQPQSEPAETICSLPPFSGRLYAAGK